MSNRSNGKGVEKEKGKFRTKLEMYDTMIASKIAGSNVLPSETKLDRVQMELGFSDVRTETTITKYLLVKKFPDYINPNFMAYIRSMCVTEGVTINFYMYGQKFKINWDSQEMINRVRAWKNFTKENEVELDAFNMRDNINVDKKVKRMRNSMLYFNVAELEHRRTTSKIYLLIELNCENNINSIINLNNSLGVLKGILKRSELKYKELKLNLIDWISSLDIFTLKNIKEVQENIFAATVTDDIIAAMDGYGQGRIGEYGIPLGQDIFRNETVLFPFKDDPNKIENWLISAMSGGGKSYWIKDRLLWFLGLNWVVTILDYEGDEYDPLAKFCAQSNPGSVKVVSMGKGSSYYFDPMEIASLTGDMDIDQDLKETALNYTLAYFRIIVVGVNGSLSRWHTSVLSTAIKRVYEEHGVTDDMSTWHKSKGLRLKMVYEEIQNIVDSKEFVDDSNDNIKHKAAVDILEACVPWFEEGEAKSGTFKKAMTLNDLQAAQLIVFSFGMKGESADTIDPEALALKQLGVSNISTQISNYAKYVLHTFNVKVWEEFQRYIETPGTASIIGNEITGGRKRGSINFIITNDLGDMLDDSNPVTKRIRQNISSFAIGAIKDREVIDKFCEKFMCPELRKELIKISVASQKKKTNKKRKKLRDGKVNPKKTAGKYENAFCLSLDTGQRAIVKVKLPRGISESSLFSTGVSKEQKSMEDSIDKK